MPMNRRAAVFGLATLAAQPVMANAEEKVSPIARGALANNSLAKEFEATQAELPDIALWGPTGKRSIRELRGRTILMPLWAEWCPPCLGELPDFARLQQKFGNDKFAIIPILTATKKAITPQLLGDLFRQMQSGVFEPLIEDNRGEKLFNTMARRGKIRYLPCNLLVAPDGRVIGREIGRLSNTEDTAPAKTAKEMINRTASGAVQSRWGQADGEEFAAAMAAGFIT